MRLVNSTIEHEGRVEVCADGVWGTVCGECHDNHFYYCNSYTCIIRQNTACKYVNSLIICRSLGYNGGLCTLMLNYYHSLSIGLTTQFHCITLSLNLEMVGVQFFTHLTVMDMKRTLVSVIPTVT